MMKAYYDSNPTDRLERSISALRAVGRLMSNCNLKPSAQDVDVDPSDLHNLLQIIECELSASHERLAALNVG